jgi:8-oxo-dGTP pyrophosphatase MutT (NUDIX family)
MRATVVDVIVVQADPSASDWKVLVLRRASGTRCPGAWEAVHGRIEEGETPEIAAQREVAEETGLHIDRLYNVICQSFYLHMLGQVQLAVVFVAFVGSGVPVRLGPEHDAFEWLPRGEAAERMVWPRTRRALGDAYELLRGGDAGPAEDVLRVL